MNQKNDESKISDDDVINFDDDNIIDFQNYDQMDCDVSVTLPKIQISDALKQCEKLQIIQIKDEKKIEQPIKPIIKSVVKQPTSQKSSDPDPELIKFKDNLYKPLHDFDFSYGLEQFLLRPAPKGGMIQCRLYRAPPKYTLFIEKLNLLILNGQKKSFKVRSSYKIFAKGRKEQYLGKIKSDFMGTKFKIYDNGKTNKKAKNVQELRNELGVIYYQPFQEKLRSIQAFIPAINSHGTQYEFKNQAPYCSITTTFENVLNLENRKPQWIEKFKSYGLNFYGRALQSSVKNFILVERGQETPLLLFGKNDDREFVLDFSYPLSPLQAFAIALSSIDHKFSCR